MTEPIRPNPQDDDGDDLLAPPPEALEAPPRPPEPLPESVLQPEVPPVAASQAQTSPIEASCSTPLTRSDEQLCAVGGRMVLAFVILLLIAGTVVSMAALAWLLWAAFVQ